MKVIRSYLNSQLLNFIKLKIPSNEIAQHRQVFIWVSPQFFHQNYNILNLL